MKTVVDSRGRITIPAEIRRKIHLKGGMELLVELKGDSIVLKPLRRIKARDLLGVAGTKKVEISEVEQSPAYINDLEKLHET